MPASLSVARGNESNLPVAKDGRIIFTKDTKKLVVDYQGESGVERTVINPNPDWNAVEGNAQIFNKPTTLSGYGITDAKIANGTVTLGNQSITPLTSSSNIDPSKISSGTAGINISGNAATATTADSATTAGSASSVPLSGVSGADKLKAIEALSGTSGYLKRTSNGWELDTPEGVKYSTDSQGLTATQKSNARKNIGLSATVENNTLTLVL